jgi:maleate isomerase
MTGALGYRRKSGVVIPSTNTSERPELGDMRPKWVTNHVSRIAIPDDPCESDADFARVTDLMARAQRAAIDAVMTCRPDYLVLGISSETFWNGLDACGKRSPRTPGSVCRWPLKPVSRRSNCTTQGASPSSPPADSSETGA